MRRKGLFLSLQLFAVTLLTSGCASVSVSNVFSALPGVGEPNESVEQVAVDENVDDELEELLVTMRQDLTAYRNRERERLATLTPVQPTVPRQTTAAVNLTPLPTELFPTRRALQGPNLLMPVVGIDPAELEDTWGASRDGGRRRHRGIDIFASRGTEIVAVMDGYISYIGDQPKGGHCVWVSTEAGYSFYYAHLDRWAPGIYEGMPVRAGDLLGFVGTTGNARRSSPHLHFSVHDFNDEAVNPYPLLRFSQLVSSASPAMTASAYSGTR